MKKFLFLVFFGLLLTPLTVVAEDTIKDYSIREALGEEKIKNVLGDDVKFYFGTQRHGKVLKKFGNFRTSKKANAFMKSKESACQWAFASSLKAFKDRALREGGNAVINIQSNYNNVRTASSETYKCGSGAAVAGVAMVGDVVRLAE